MRIPTGTATGILTGVLLFAACASASSIGSDLVMQGAGEVTIYYLGHTADYTNQLIDLTLGSNPLFWNRPAPEYGHAVSLGHFEDGQQLAFGLFVRTRGYTWYTGSGARNADRQTHSRTAVFAGNGTVPAGLLLSFEDMWYLGDRDFDDMVVVLAVTPDREPDSPPALPPDQLIDPEIPDIAPEPEVNVEAIPEPGTLCLFAGAAAALAIRRRLSR